MTKKRTPQAKRRAVLLSEAERHLIAASLGAYQQLMEKAAHLSYGFTTEKQRSQMINHGIDCINLRNDIFRQWFAEESPK